MSTIDDLKRMLDNLDKSNAVQNQYGFWNNVLSERIFKTDEFDTFKKEPILESNFSRVLEHINSKAPLMMVSACTGKRENETDDEHYARNKKQSKVLQRDIEGSGMAYIPMEGHWVSFDKNTGQYEDMPEISFMILGYRRDKKVIDYDIFFEYAIKWCKKYNQYCVLVGRATDNGLDYGYYDSTGNICLNEDGSEQRFNVYSLSSKEANEIAQNFNDQMSKHLIGTENVAGFSTYRKHKKSTPHNVHLKKSIDSSVIYVIRPNNLPYGRENTINVI